MPLIQYIEKGFSNKNVAIIRQANEIINEYQAEGMELTLRQLYYQFVSRDLLTNKMSEYKKLGNVINDARLAGLVDWNAIVDRTRNLQSNNHWNDPGEIMYAAAASFHLDHWAGQENYVEVWIEKEALIGVIAGICEDLDVPYFACKGYNSSSEQWRAAQRMLRKQKKGMQPYIIHLGDHDPSGIDMTRDIQERHEMFGAKTIVKRIALNMHQVEEYNPPPNPAKLTDTRATSYIDLFGNSSWELDALEPKILRNLINDMVADLRDEEVYQDILKQENTYRDVLDNVAENWETL